MKPQLAIIGLRGFPGVQGGVESHCAALIPALGIPARVYRRKPFLTPGSATVPGIEFIDLPSTRIKGIEAALHTLLASIHILLHPVAVVNVHNIGPALFIPLLKMRGISIVTTYHSANYLHSKWGRFAKWMLKAGEKIAFKFSDKIIFVSSAMYNTHRQHLGGRATFIPNAVPAATYEQSTGFVSSLGAEPRGYILAVGRITPEKGFDTLIRAARGLPPGIKIIIAGACTHSAGYLDSLKRLDTGHRVIFAGFVQGKELAELYTHARLFVLPSLHEGLSLSLLEAMSYSLPVCASDIEANRLPQLIGKATFFSPGNPEHLASALIHCLSGAGRCRYDLTDYSLSTIAGRTAGIYRSLLP